MLLKKLVGSRGVAARPQITTIGLGAQLDSELLMGFSDAFLHMPDPGCVGPFMVSMLAALTLTLTLALTLALALARSTCSRPSAAPRACPTRRAPRPTTPLCSSRRAPHSQRRPATRGLARIPALAPALAPDLIPALAL